MSNQNRSFNVAVVGATGAVGETMLSILAERDFPVGKLVALASERSAGGEVEFNGQKITIQDLATFDPAGIDIALFSAGGGVSKEYAPKFAAAGAVVIDNSSAFRYDDDVPLVVSEVNPEQVQNRPRGIIANPNCSTMQMLVALAPIHRKAGIERINVATYQSVSGGGRSALEELGRQTGALLNFQDPDPQRFPVQIAFNLIPHIDEFLDNGFTKEEMKLVWETRKILGDDSIQVNPTAVRVPVFYGHSEAVNVETRVKLSAAEARALLENAPGVEVVDDRAPGGYPTPVTHASGTDPVYVGRIREDLSHPRGLNLWIVADNIRKGAALNAVQLAELVAKNG
ncbi:MULTISPECIES: aspartate-semialdehyde dehydrogenase [unclassified Pseudoxanthomonas]|jgi:aspartate-semialdehyde dehydrogenase|uniref:aspartate-semialdehyde dehydrogenase n=1 Tax=unclassified Pseudoxanthomonas TaxID=2645906 RepID=UPI001613F007|nr:MULTISPECIES: aspartate-semialdehyde dehydrogenase [unclassified Pseudoxanthomonas]MBB3277193.1 aspartate-semialdehyde dehydrogenase [Pseudoxanthomonas sp. OG2]MBD9376497.1 aspartate-semialdehyde dehydrogenase [Pseudoxanthomonas sp. PXM04]MBV7473958.1 aspartate-semialdehyde dehydrogenase [Pseudoxanthomonas sp. PXM05]UBB26456.1 aspartate-semialdehyde dehydrogenase [Pseudoxanthomonas japonensis]